MLRKKLHLVHNKYRRIIPNITSGGQINEVRYTCTRERQERIGESEAQFHSFLPQKLMHVSVPVGFRAEVAP